MTGMYLSTEIFGHVLSLGRFCTSVRAGFVVRTPVHMELVRASELYMEFVP